MTSTVDQTQHRFDEEAAAAYREEAQRHARAMSALHSRDLDAFADEFNRHLDRIYEILCDRTRRNAFGGGAGRGGV